jgi:hypothetical protein
MTALHVTPTSPAMASALHEIRRAFGPGSDVRDLKRRLRQVFRFPDHPRWRARYGARAAHIAEAVICHRHMNATPAPSLAIAINVIERAYRAERRTILIADALSRRPCLDFMVLRELRLILRVIRRSNMAPEFPRLLSEFAQ